MSVVILVLQMKTMRHLPWCFESPPLFRIGHELEHFFRLCFIRYTNEFPCRSFGGFFEHDAAKTIRWHFLGTNTRYKLDLLLTKEPIVTCFLKGGKSISRDSGGRFSGPFWSILFRCSPRCPALGAAADIRSL